MTYYDWNDIVIASGYQYLYNKVSKGYYKEMNNVLKIILPICKELGYFPSKKYFIENGLKKYYSGITKYHDWHNVIKKSGYEEL